MNYSELEFLVYSPSGCTHQLLSTCPHGEGAAKSPTSSSGVGMSLTNGGGTPSLNPSALDPAAEMPTPLPCVMEEEPDWTPGIQSERAHSRRICRNCSSLK